MMEQQLNEVRIAKACLVCDYTTGVAALRAMVFLVRRTIAPGWTIGRGEPPYNVQSWERVLGR